MSNTKSKRPTWRDGMIAAAADARGRMQCAREDAQRADLIPEVARDEAIAFAFGVIADECAYIASLPAHEGLERMQKMGTNSSRAWASAYAERGYGHEADNAEAAAMAENMMDRADRRDRAEFVEFNAPAEPPPAPVEVELNDYERKLVTGHAIIPAIKSLRERTPGLGLRDAKNAVDKYRKG